MLTKMRTTMRLYLFLLFFPIIAHTQSVVASTDSNGVVYSSIVYDTAVTTSSDAFATSTDSLLTSSYASTTISTSYTTGSTDNGATTTGYPPISTSVPAIQTVPFTGQALLIGTCAIARFTMLTFPDGGSIEVPLVGCSDDRPECCPSLDFNQTTAAETSSDSASATESSGEEEPTTSWTATTPSPTPTGILSMLSRAPLSVCPNDMVDIDPVCCPSGFQVYGQVLVGNYPPCVSILTTVITPDSSVLASITSVVAASLAKATTTTTVAPTVSVVITQVLALGLPCAEDDEEHHGTHLSTGAKAGIGAGAGVLGLLIIGFFWGCLAVRHRRRKKLKALQAANTDAGGPIRPEAGAYAATKADPKHMSTATSTIGSPMMQQQQLYGAPTPHGFSPAFGYAPQGQMPGHMVQHDAYGQPYGIEHMAQGYTGDGNPYPQSQSPPPPFYSSGTGTYAPGYKPPAEVAGDEVHQGYAGGGNRHSTGISDTQSQVTSTTAVTGSHYQRSETRSPLAELSTHASTRH